MLKFLKDWALPISIVVGVVMYFVFTALPLPYSVHILAGRVVSVVQPLLIFSMLFLSFCKIKPNDLRLCPWHAWLLGIQVLSFIIPALVIIRHPDMEGRILLESAMLCMICPTATAAAVVVGKLGGNAAHLVTYTVIINLTASIVIPLFAPLVHPQEGLTFLSASAAIIAKVFPLLICPLLLAWAVRYALPPLGQRLEHTGDLAFYIWTVSLSLAIAVSTRSIVHSRVGVLMLGGIALVSLLCCIVQFWLGKRIGAVFDRRSAAILSGKGGMREAPVGHVEKATAGQSFGQKNTVFLIWLAYTFFTPVTAIAGGFYCIWHNVINSWQLYRVQKEKA